MNVAEWAVHYAVHSGTPGLTATISDVSCERSRTGSDVSPGLPGETGERSDGPPSHPLGQNHPASHLSPLSSAGGRDERVAGLAP